MYKLFVHIVTFNSEHEIGSCVRALQQQQGYTLGKNLYIEITDNASSDATCEKVREQAMDGVQLRLNSKNVGFCAAHNQGVAAFLRSDAEVMLILNPDVILEADALNNASIELAAFKKEDRVGLACIRLYRSTSDGAPVMPRTYDSTGMVFTSSWRHFDRGSEELDEGQYETSEYVAGATGACLLMTRACVEALLLRGAQYDGDVTRVYPQLAAGRTERAPLFDEAFFAYREDAELSLRAHARGWRCWYIASSVGYHTRRVLPERRAELSPDINALGVRNRFLLQIAAFNWREHWKTFLSGIVWRNFVVLAAVCTVERESLRTLGELRLLWRRAWERRSSVAPKGLRA